MKRKAAVRHSLQLSPGIGPARLRAMVSREGLACRRSSFQVQCPPLPAEWRAQQPQHLLGALLECHVLEAALHLGPFRPPPGDSVLGVAVERLVQNGEEEEWPLGTRRRLRPVLAARTRRRVPGSLPRIRGTCPTRPRSAGCPHRPNRGPQVIEGFLEQANHGRPAAVRTRLLGKPFQFRDEGRRAAEFLPGSQGGGEGSCQCLLQGLARPADEDREEAAPIPCEDRPRREQALPPGSIR